MHVEIERIPQCCALHSMTRDHSEAGICQRVVDICLSSKFMIMPSPGDYVVQTYGATIHYSKKSNRREQGIWYHAKHDGIKLTNPLWYVCVAGISKNIMATLHIKLLHTFAIQYDKETMTSVNTPRLQSLLAYLLLHRHEPQPRQHIAFALWYLDCPYQANRRSQTDVA